MNQSQNGGGRSNSTGKPWKVALLGAGYISDWHCRALRKIPGVQIVAVCDQAETRAAALARSYSIPRFCKTLDSLFDGHSVDVVHNLLPPETHFSLSREILKHGAHVLLEKPMCLQPRECEELEQLAASQNRVIGVSHNFLFSPVYEKLKADIARKEFGPLDHVSITWHKEMGAIRSGPSHIFALRGSANILLEVAPHSFAHALDLLGVPETLHVFKEDPVRLASEQIFYRRWYVRGQVGKTALEMRFSFGPGSSQHQIEVRGLAGCAIVDFEKNTYVASRAGAGSLDFDNCDQTVARGKALINQARGNLSRYVLSKMKLAKDGNSFGGSIRRSLACFYGQLPSLLDRRLTAGFGREVVSLAHQVASTAGVVLELKAPSAVAIPPKTPPDILVLGGTGFIGRELVRQLVESGKSVRLLARDPAGLPRSIRNLPLEVIRGDLLGSNLEPVLQGISTVYHLARSVSCKSREDYLKQDVAPTRELAEACLHQGVKRLIYTGTIDSYYSGILGDVITEATPLDPKIERRNLYAWAKADSEKILLDLHKEKGLPVVLFRPGIVIGPGGNPSHWGVGFWPTDHVCRYWGDGTNLLPFVLAEDVAKGLVLGGTVSNLEGKSFNLVSEPCLNAREYVAVLEEALGTRIDARPMAAWKTYLNDMGKWVVKCAVRHPNRRMPSYRDWQTRSHKARFDCSETARVLGWSTQVGKEKLLEQGVRQAARDWLLGC